LRPLRFIILGAGLSGLSCAVAIAMNGHQVVVIEKESEVGGLARCHRINGYTFDYGPHFIFGSKVLPMLKKKLASNITLMSMSRNMERMYFKNRYFKFPFEPKNLLLNMEPAKTPGVIFDLLWKNILKNRNESLVKNVEDWVIHSVGRRIYDYTSLGGYIWNLYGIPPKDISADWGIQKLKFLTRLQKTNLFQMAIKTLREKKHLQAQVVNYPQSGIDHLPIQVANKLIDLGGKIYFGSKASRIELKRNGILVHLQENGNEEKIEGDFLISTIPITNLTQMIIPTPPIQIVEAIHHLRYRALLLLFLCIEKEQEINYGCIYFTETNSPFRRITEFKNLDKTMAPEKKTSLCVEMTCFENDEIFRSDKATIFKTVGSELEKRGLSNMRDVKHYSLLKIPHAYPVYHIDYNAALDKLLNYLNRHDRVISIGRQGLFSYNTMSNSIWSSYQIGKTLSTAGEDGFRIIIQNVYRERMKKYCIH